MYSSQDASCIDKLYEMGIKPFRNQLEFSALKTAMGKFDFNPISKLLKNTDQNKPIDTLRLFVEMLTLQEDDFLSDGQMMNLIFILLIKTKEGSRSSQLFQYVKEQIAGMDATNVFSILEVLKQEQILNTNTYNAVMSLMKSKYDDSFAQKNGWTIEPCQALEFGLKNLGEKKILSEVSFHFFCMGYVSELKADNNLTKGKIRVHLEALVSLISVLEKSKLLNEAIVNQFFKHKTSYSHFKECIALLTEHEVCKVSILKENETSEISFYRKASIPKAIQAHFNENDCCAGRRGLLHLVNNEAYIHWEQDFEILSKKLDVKTVDKLKIMGSATVWSCSKSIDAMHSFRKLMEEDAGTHYSNCHGEMRILKEVKTNCGISPREKNALNLESFKLINDKIKANHFDNNENLFDFFKMLKAFAVYDICDNYPGLLPRILNEVDGTALSPYKNLVKDIIHFEKNGLLRDDIITILLDRTSSENLLQGLILLGNYGLCSVDNTKLLKESQSPLDMAKDIETNHLDAASQYNKDRIVSDIFLNMFSFFHAPKDKQTLSNLSASCKQFGDLVKKGIT